MTKKQLFYIILMLLAVLSCINSTVAAIIGAIFTLYGAGSLLCVVVYRNNPKLWSRISDNKGSGVLLFDILPDVKFIADTVDVMQSVIFLVVGCIMLSGLYTALVRSTAIEFIEFIK